MNICISKLDRTVTPLTNPLVTNMIYMYNNNVSGIYHIIVTIVSTITKKKNKKNKKNKKILNRLVIGFQIYKGCFKYLFLLLIYDIISTTVKDTSPPPHTTPSLSPLFSLSLF